MLSEGYSIRSVRLFNILHPLSLSLPSPYTLHLVEYLLCVCVCVCLVWVKKRKEGESCGERSVVTETGGDLSASSKHRTTRHTLRLCMELQTAVCFHILFGTCATLLPLPIPKPNS